MNDSFGNTNFNQPPFAPVGSGKPKSKLIKAVFLVVLVLVVLGGCLWAFNYYKEKNKNENPTVTSQPALTIPVVKSSLLANSKIYFPDIEKEIILDVENISKDVKEIINIASGASLEAKEVIYVGGEKGQTIKFNIKTPMLDYYQGIQKKIISKEWKVLFGFKTNLDAIWEVENKNLTLRILVSELVKNSTNVYIQTIQK